MLNAILQLALSYDTFDVGEVYQEYWEEYFISHFLMNSRYSFRYLDEIRKEKGGVLSREDAQYIQESLTGIKIDLNSISNEGLDLDAASSFYTAGGEITLCNVTEGESGECHITGEIAYGCDGVHFEDKDGNPIYAKKAKVEAALRWNPESCFNGFTIESVRVYDKETVLTESVEHKYEREFDNLFGGEVEVLKYSYPEEFYMTKNLKRLIENVVAHGTLDSDEYTGQRWKEQFVQSYL